MTPTPVFVVDVWGIQTVLRTPRYGFVNLGPWGQNPMRNRRVDRQVQEKKVVDRIKAGFLIYPMEMGRLIQVFVWSVQTIMIVLPCTVQPLPAKPTNAKTTFVTQCRPVVAAAMKRKNKNSMQNYR